MSHRLLRPICLTLALLGLVLPNLGCGGKGADPAPVPTNAYDPSFYREAGRITGLGALEVMRTARPGQSEGDLKATLDASFRSSGSQALAFPHIVAAGANALSLHYEGSAGVLKTGELVLMDIGAMSSGIASDCSRTFPVAGTFTPRQRELYQVVLDAQQAAIANFRVNQSTLEDLDNLAAEVMMTSPVVAKDAAGKSWTLEHFFIHFVGHHVGKTVHAEYLPYTSKTVLKPGMVITLEPGVYIATESIGIRIEDTFLVTPQGLEALTSQCPKEIAAIEALRKSPTASAMTEVSPLKARSQGPHLVPRN